MGIPGIIHYCWFGGKPLPRLARRCIASWRSYCPDFEIRRWDEGNFDFSGNRYASEAYELGKWAFLSDYARLQILYTHGGIYLDTDVELLRPLPDWLLEQEGFMGFERSRGDFLAATGLGFGVRKGHPLIAALLADYDGIPFRREDGSLDRTSCPMRTSATLQGLGLRLDGSGQRLQGIVFLPADYLSPKDYDTRRVEITSRTISIHHYGGAWQSRMTG